MHPCAHSRKKTTQTNQRGKEVLLKEDALVVMRKGHFGKHCPNS
jgi:hypothetical protein